MGSEMCIRDRLIRPFQYIFLSASENFTIVLSVDRFIAVKYPLRYYSSFRASTFDSKLNYQCKIKGTTAKIKNGTGRVDKTRVAIYSSSVFLFSVLYCIPVFFEYETVLGNETSPPSIRDSKMALTEEYTIIYYVMLDSIFRFILPVCILFYTNYGIYKIISNQPVILNDASYQKKVQNVMLFGVVILLSLIHI